MDHMDRVAVRSVSRLLASDVDGGGAWMEGLSLVVQHGLRPPRACCRSSGPCPTEASGTHSPTYHARSTYSTVVAAAAV